LLPLWAFPYGVAKIGHGPFSKKFYTYLFILGSVLAALLNRYIYFTVPLGGQHITAAEYKSYYAGYLQVKQEGRGRDPVVSEVFVLHFLEFLLIFLCVAHSVILCCKNKGSV